MADSGFYKNGGVGPLEEKCTDPATSKEYNFSCQKYANYKAQRSCSGQTTYYWDRCISADGKIFWREMCGGEKEAFGNQDGWMFATSNYSFYFFVSKEDYQDYLDTYGDFNYGCTYSGPMSN